MTGDEIAFWTDQAALLDPDAYEFIQGTGESETVPADERWYLVNGWFLKVHDDGEGHWFHRTAHVDHALMLPEGFTIETSASQANAFMYLCKPSLVTGSDGRYTTDPRGLYFERIMRLGELTRYQIGITPTGSGSETKAFDADFTDGLALHVSSHDVAWLVMLVAGGTTGGINTLNEISDSDPIRFAEDCLFPFKRTTFDSVSGQGVSAASGAANLVFVKLPGDW